MGSYAVQLEETRLQGIDDIGDYSSFHERHRIFPVVFEGRQHKRIIDIAAGVGCTARRIQENYPAELLCNDVSPTCLRILKGLGIRTTSFDIDDEAVAFPFPDGYFDAVIALATIEHVIHLDHFVQEIHRLLSVDGYLYLSAPNYQGLLYLWRFLRSGRTFHDPLSGPASRYEFYAHVRYFTYRTLLEFVSTFGFAPDTVYLALPEQSSRYRALFSRSRPKALAYQYTLKLIYHFLSPRWAAEPVICFRKSSSGTDGKPRKVVL